MVCVKKLLFAPFVAMLGFGVMAASSPVLAAPSVSEIRLGIHSGKVRVVLEADAKLAATAFELGGPLRIVLDLPDVEWRVDPARGERGRGFIGSFRFGQFAPGRSRMVLDLTKPALVDKLFHIPPVGDRPWRLVLDLTPVTAEAFTRYLTRPDAPKAEPPSRTAVVVPLPRPAPAPAPAARKKVVVIDPGHGGIDPGAVGRRKVYEKVITLAMAEQLQKELNRRGRYRVVLTRDKDTFVRLRERVAMARAAGADLFISLHADSIANRKVRGASVYTLSETASDKEAGDLAAKENKADLIAGMNLTGESTEVTNILIDLAQRETMNHSAAFARVLVDDMADLTKFVRKSHRFAGFAVLKAPDVPSVLIEMGYLSNSADEARLLKPSYRVDLAKAIAEAIDAYFKRRARENGQ
jgi:N-acetylmuramoyl-L-alanine amidase